MIEGIDVSSYQSETFSTQNRDFCFVKATEGTSYVNPKQWAQADHARRAGLVVGFYHYLRPGDMATQARYFVEKCASRPGDPLWCDWEETHVSCRDKDAFLREVLRLRGDAHRVGLYCSQNFWLHHDTTSYCAETLWIANYNGKPGDPGIQHPWKFHQYTSAPIDTSVGAFTSRAALKAWAAKKPAPPAQEGTVSISDADAKKIAEATADRTMHWDGVTPPNPTKLNPHWETRHAIEDIWKRADRIEAKLDRLLNMKLNVPDA